MTATQPYLADAITTASPTQLVQLMYEGALSAIDRAAAAEEAGAHEALAFEIDRTVRIVVELQSVLDFGQGGEIALNLDALYTFCLGLLADAAEAASVEPLGAVVAIIAELRDAWARSFG